MALTITVGARDTGLTSLFDKADRRVATLTLGFAKLQKVIAAAGGVPAMSKLPAIGKLPSAPGVLAARFLQSHFVLPGGSIFPAGRIGTPPFLPPAGGTPSGGIGGIFGGGAGSFISAGSILSHFVPGVTGRILGGAAQGATIGSQIFPGIGTIVGAGIGGLLGGIFGGGKKQKDPVRAAIKRWVAEELWPALSELKRLGFGPGAFGSFHPGGTNFFKAMGFTSGIPQQILRDMQKMAKDMKEIIANALKAGFDSVNIQSGFARFLVNIRRGLAEYVEQGFIQGILKAGLLSQAIAPFIQETTRLTRRFGKGKISEDELAAGVSAAFNIALPGIMSLERVFQNLARIWSGLSGQIRGAPAPGGAFMSVPVTVTVHASLKSPLEAQQVGENIAWGIEKRMKQATFQFGA